MSEKNVQVKLKSRPSGWVEETNFEIVETNIPRPEEGQLVVKNLWLSLDPYMRGRMDDAKSYAPKVEIGEVMVGGTVGVVHESKNSRYEAGEYVTGNLGWQKYALTDGVGLSKVDPDFVPLSANLGVVGMPGITAWYGLLEIGHPKEGETVMVSAASGAVGSVVGQIAKIKGCRVVGVAGGKQKCDYTVQELGFDVCLDYKTAEFYDKLKEATPEGVDVYFDNVGGEVLHAALRRLNPHGRIPLCGTISDYNSAKPQGLESYRVLLTKRLKVQGFIISEHMELWPVAKQQLSQWVKEGKLKYRETVSAGLENAPKAFIGLLKGANFGKQLVKIQD